LLCYKHAYYKIARQADFVPISLSLYWRLSLFYFFYFGALGVLAPYWGPYLQARGFSPAEIGELMALLALTRIIAPNLGGWLADHDGRSMRIVRFSSFFAALCFSALFVAEGYWQLALVMGTFSFFWNAALPQFEATTLGHLGAHSHRYSLIRLWGSIGFIVTVMLLGQGLNSFNITHLVPPVLLALFSAIWVAGWAVPEHVHPAPTGTPPRLAKVLRQPAVLALFGVCFLMQAGHGAYYAFYSIHLENAGYSPLGISTLWSLGVIAEVALFIVMHHLIRRFGLRTLLLLSLVLAAVRWLVIGAFVENAVLLVVAQLFHAASFGLYHAAAIHLIHRHFPGKLQGRGQALYSSLSFGAGNAVGTLISGYAWATLGAQTTFALASLMCALGFAIAWIWVGKSPALQA
jgi:MFS transporter, PPP family, 3-phenylpropionic acid transporter